MNHGLSVRLNMTSYATCKTDIYNSINFPFDHLISSYAFSLLFGLFSVGLLTYTHLLANYDGNWLPSW